MAKSLCNIGGWHKTSLDACLPQLSRDLELKKCGNYMYKCADYQAIGASHSCWSICWSQSIKYYLLHYVVVPNGTNLCDSISVLKTPHSAELLLAKVGLNIT